MSDRDSRTGAGDAADRSASPVTPPVALTVAASDAGGGAGVQADLKAMAAHGVFGTSVLTAVTAQNTRSVESVHVLPTDEIAAQYEAVVSDFDVGAVKTGMLATAEVVELVADRVRELDAPLVVDPVMVAASGDRLLEPAGEAAYEELIAAATLVTPNADEAEVLTGVEIESAADARRAGAALCEAGAEAALVKGGHVPGETVRDVLVTADSETPKESRAAGEAGDGEERRSSGSRATPGDGERTFEHPRIETDATHGSGCALAGAVAARFARGDGIEAAVERGVDHLAGAVRHPLDVGEGPGCVNHLLDRGGDPDG